MIPEGWERTTIGEHVHVLTGFAFKSSDYSDGPDDIRLLRGDNVAQHRIRWRDAKKLPQEKAQGLDRFALKLGDFVIALDRTWIPAGVKIAEVNEADLPCLLVQRVARLRSKPSLEQSLMRQFFGGHGFEQYVKSVQTETAVPHISPNDLRDLSILLPPLQEQKQIAETLEIWDRAIDKVEALIANARAQKQALMQQLLPQGTTPPKKRLPGLSEEWQEVALADVLAAKRAKGKIVPTNEVGEGVPYIGSTSFLGEFSNYTTSQDALLCTETDILVLWDGEYAGKAATGLAGAVSSTVGRYRLAKDMADSVFILTLMENASERIRAIREGSGVPHVPGDFEHWFRFSLPPLGEQQAIAEAFIANRAQTDQLETQLSALRQEKAALMQQLLTGKRRVKLPESEVA